MESQTLFLELFEQAGSCKRCPRGIHNNIRIVGIPCQEHHPISSAIMIILRDPSCQDGQDGRICAIHHEHDMTARFLKRAICDYALNLVYLTNAVICGFNNTNKPPKKATRDACRPYLQKQIDLINPKIIITMGKDAALSVRKIYNIDHFHKLSTIAGTIHLLPNGSRLLHTFHPGRGTYHSKIRNHLKALFS